MDMAREKNLYGKVMEGKEGSQESKHGKIHVLS